MLLHVSNRCALHQVVKIALHSLRYHHTYRCDDEHMCSKHVEVARGLSKPVHETAAYRCDDTRG